MIEANQYTDNYIEALAIAHLRRWAARRQSNLSGKTRNPEARGWCRRDERTYDANLVYVMDFEKALNQLKAHEQVALIFRYRDKRPDADTAQALGCSLRTIANLIPKARRKLAQILDRLNLL